MDSETTGVLGLGYERVLYACPGIQSRAAQVALRYDLSLRDPTAGYLGWLAFRERLLKQWVIERGVLSCHYCGRNPLLITGHVNDIATIDHVIPRSRGGKKFDISNLVVACCKCNYKKADSMPHE